MHVVRRNLICDVINSRKCSTSSRPRQLAVVASAPTMCSETSDSATTRVVFECVPQSEEKSSDPAGGKECRRRVGEWMLALLEGQAMCRETSTKSVWTDSRQIQASPIRQRSVRRHYAHVDCCQSPPPVSRVRCQLMPKTHEPKIVARLSERVSCENS